MKSKRYKFWGYEWHSKPNLANVGFWALLVIITFPIWVWGWIVYQLLRKMGRTFKRDIKVEEEEES